MALVLEGCIFRDGIRNGLRKECATAQLSPGIAASA